MLASVFILFWSVRVFAEGNFSSFVPLTGFASMLDDDRRGYDGCWCRNGTMDVEEIACRCRGKSIEEIPRNLTKGVNRISLTSVSIPVLKSGWLQIYKSSLTDLLLDSVKSLCKIESGAFNDLDLLRTISIKQAPLLKTIGFDVFRCKLSNLKMLRIVQSGLETIPDLQSVETRNIIYMIDLDSNRINHLTTGSVKMKTEILNLDYNLIREIQDWAFNGSEIAKLSLKGNKKLSTIGDDAFAGLKNIRKVDLSKTSIQYLPVKGLEEIEDLRLVDVYALKVFPSVFHFKFIQRAHLTYPYHCCAFKFPASHDPKEFDRYRAIKEDMERKYCSGTTTPTPPDPKVVNDITLMQGSLKILSHQSIKFQGAVKGGMRRISSEASAWGGISETELPHQSFRLNSSHLSYPVTNGDSSLKFFFVKGLHPPEVTVTGAFDSVGPVEGIFHRTTVSFGSQVELQAFCGTLSKNYRDVECDPSPDAFNPCEDVMGNEFLRVVVWLVVIMSMTGNFTVMVVLMSTGIQSNVSKFLMCNLAFADFCMGCYLMMIAAMDFHSVGTYFNYAIYWQHGLGCQVAGFLTIFATELSIFTLTVISVERWYAITNTINLHKRLNLNTAAKIMAFGWIYAITMASLPVAGVNGYTRTSICLPMEDRNIRDLAYLVILLVINSLAFVFIFFCYGNMYASVIRHQGSATINDMSVAKRMALLVITDFMCWAPVAFFVTTALGGYPLIDVTKSKILLVFFYPLNSCANPFLYAILTTQYRRDFLMLFRHCVRCTEWTKKHEDTQSCNFPALQRSMSSRIRRSLSSIQASPESFKSVKPVADTKLELLSVAGDDHLCGPTPGEDDSIQLWSPRRDPEASNKVDFRKLASFKMTERTPICSAQQGSPHPLKNRMIHLSIPRVKTSVNKTSLC